MNNRNARLTLHRELWEIAGTHPVGVDVSPAQLDTARRCQQEHDACFPLVEADVGNVPLRNAAFDLAVSEYGAAPWCDPAAAGDVWVAHLVPQPTAEAPEPRRQPSPGLSV